MTRISALLLATALVPVLGLGAMIENSNIQVEINGDGKVGALVHKVDPQNNNLNDASMRIKFSGSIVETKRIEETEKVYAGSQLFVGYGAGVFSNLYIFTVGNIPKDNDAVNTFCIVTSRFSDDNMGIIHYVDADIYGTVENDWAEPFNTANYVITTQETKDRYVGFTGRCASLAPNSFMIDDVDKVIARVQSSSLPNTINTNSSPNLAGALGYARASIGMEAVRVTSKLMIGSSNGDIQQLTNTSDAPVHFKGYGDVTGAKLKFTQKFKKVDKDSMTLSFFVNEIDQAEHLSWLSDFDVAFYMGHDLYFSPGDGTEANVKGNKRVHKYFGTNGKKVKLVLKYRKDGQLKVSFTLKGGAIGGATGLNYMSSNGKAKPLFLPFNLALIGTSMTDATQRGQVWLVSGSVPALVDVVQGKNAKGWIKY